MPFRGYATGILATFTGMVVVGLMASCTKVASTEAPSAEATSVEPPSTGDTSTEPASTEVTSIESPSTGATSSGVLMEYHQSGGFVGLDDHLTIYTDRRATLTRKAKQHAFALAQETLERLLQQLDQAEFSRLEREYLPANTCCDLIEYTITYAGHTVRTMDTAVPESLQPILNSLNEIIETRGKP